MQDALERRLNENTRSVESLLSGLPQKVLTEIKVRQAKAGQK